jgi:predicted 2-oxoglutarate/Fe(II)-dependent dioxygenase YbiX
VKYLRHKDLIIIFDFIDENELNILDEFFRTTLWVEAPGDDHYSANITSNQVGDTASKIRDRLKSTIEKEYSCELSNEALGTFVKYRLNKGLRLHHDSSLTTEISGKPTKYKTFSGCPTIDISSTIYFGECFSGGDISFPKLNFTYHPLRGSAIIFPSSKRYEHQVSPVTSGERIMTSIFWHNLTKAQNAKNKNS